MPKNSNRVLVIFVSVLFLGSLPGQERIRETRLVVKSQPGERIFTDADYLLADGSLGSKLFAYSRIMGKSHLVILKEGREVTLLTREKIHDVQVSRDDSRIIFATSGMSWYYPTVIYSVRPDGSELKMLVGARFDCEGSPPKYGSPYCSFPRRPRLSPDGQKVIFFEEVNSFDEEKQGNISREYLSMIPVTGGPVVRLKEMASRGEVVWSEDSSSIYYYSFDGLVRYDLDTGRSESIADESWKLGRSSRSILYGPGFGISRADGSFYFISRRGLARVDPMTGSAEVVSGERLDTFDLSPDGRRAAGLKDGDIMIIDLEFPSSSRLVIEPEVVDELELGRIPAARRKWARQAGYAATSRLPFEVAERNGVKRVRWLDNERLWCVVQEDKSTDPTRASKPEVRVGIVRLTN